MSTTKQNSENLLRLASRASVATATFLLVIKLIAFIMTESVSIMASLLDSLLDIVASLINLFAIKFALTPPDKEHPFGHGKAEALAGLGQATFIAGSALFLIYQAILRLQSPAEVSETQVGILVMVISMTLTFALIMFQKYVIRQTNSVAIKADSVHYLTDLLTNAMIIVALLLVNLGFIWMDPAMAILLGVYILYSAWGIIWESIQLLLDRELPEDIQQRVRNLVLSDPDVEAIHDLKTRDSGQIQFIQLHVEMDGSMTLNEAHLISDRIMKNLKTHFSKAEILIHQDPFNDAEDQQYRVTLNP